MLLTAVFGAIPARADCDPAVTDCPVVPIITTPPPPFTGYVVSYIDDRQFNALLILTAITAAVTLAQFVWRASTGLKLGAVR